MTANKKMPSGLILPETPVKKSPKETILEPLNDHLKDIEVFGNRLMVGIYSSNTLGSSGLIKADITKDEDKWQGTVGLVLAMGPGCFKDSDKWKFYGQSVKVGDWIVFRPSDGILQKIGGADVRLLQDAYVLEKVSQPDLVA